MIFSPTNSVVTVLKINLLIILPAPSLGRICSLGGAFFARSRLPFDVDYGMISAVPSEDSVASGDPWCQRLKKRDSLRLLMVVWFLVRYLVLSVKVPSPL